MNLNIIKNFTLNNKVYHYYSLKEFEEKTNFKVQNLPFSTRILLENLLRNQIDNFAKSVFLRIREIKYKELFILKDDLYPGEYIVEIAKKANNPVAEFRGLGSARDLSSSRSTAFHKQLSELLNVPK